MEVSVFPAAALLQTGFPLRSNRLQLLCFFFLTPACRAEALEAKAGTLKPPSVLITPLSCFRTYVPVFSTQLPQVLFMPYGLSLKDERPTSNIERPTSNEKTNIKYRTFNGYFFFFPALRLRSGP
jgi:hypothetical protein